MALKIMRNNVPLDQIYGTKGASTAAATGCMQNGVDVNQSLLALADGKALGYNSGLLKNNTDFSAIFGIPTGNTPLPINGQSFSASSQSGTTTSVANMTFSTNASSWQMAGSASPAGSVSPTQSGTPPTGAVTVQYAVTVSSQAGTGSYINQASSPTALSSTPVVRMSASSTPSTGDNGIQASVVITYYNSASQAISTTTVNMHAEATGSS